MMLVLFATAVAVAAVAVVAVIAFVDVAFHPPQYSAATAKPQKSLPPLGSCDLFTWFSESAERLTRGLISARRDAEQATRSRNDADVAQQDVIDTAFCATKTAVTPEETLEIARYLQQTQPPEVVDEIREKACDNSRKVGTADSAEYARAGVRCPLLCDNGTCVALPVRPVQCRVRCELFGHEVSRADDDRRRMILNGTEAGVSRAMTGAGMDGELYELNSALETALFVSDAAEQWAAGENPFEECVPYHAHTESNA